MERSEVHDALSKAESLVASLEEEKKKLTEELKNVKKAYVVAMRTSHIQLIITIKYTD